jgi:glucose-6-phosphate isomerase
MAIEPPAPWAATATLGALAPAVEQRLEQFAAQHVVRRTWENDHTLWKPTPAEISNRLEWLTVADQMLGKAPDLAAFRREVVTAGIEWVVLLGMGGSSLAPEVIRATFGSPPEGPDLIVLDSTDPVQIGRVEAQIDRDRTLFIVASKSGGTIETRSHFDYFWEKLPKGDHFVVITDPGSNLEALGRQRKVRRIFLNPAGIGGRYSALSFFGLVPAALIGVDLAKLLEQAQEMMHACHHEVPLAENPGAWLGAVLGEAALAGRIR